jgi:hypothetical protein
MSALIFQEYISFFDDKVSTLSKEVDLINRQKELLIEVGKTSTILGYLIDENETNQDVNSLRVVTIGDLVSTKFGRKGKILSFDFKKYKDSGKFSEVFIEFEDLSGDVCFLCSTRLI